MRGLLVGFAVTVTLIVPLPVPDDGEVNEIAVVRYRPRATGRSGQESRNRSARCGDWSSCSCPASRSTNCWSCVMVTFWLPTVKNADRVAPLLTAV